ESGSGVDQTQPGRIADEICSVLEAEHAHDLVLMGLDGSRRDLERARTLPHPVALGNELKDLALPWRELGKRLLSNRKTANSLRNLRAHISSPGQDLLYWR